MVAKQPNAPMLPATSMGPNAVRASTAPSLSLPTRMTGTIASSSETAPVPRMTGRRSPAA